MAWSMPAALRSVSWAVSTAAAACLRKRSSAASRSREGASRNPRATTPAAPRSRTSGETHTADAPAETARTSGSERTPASSVRTARVARSRRTSRASPAFDGTLRRSALAAVSPDAPVQRRIARAESRTRRTPLSAPESRQAHRAAHMERSPRPEQRASSASIAASVSPDSRLPLSSAIGTRPPRLAAPLDSEAGDGLVPVVEHLEDGIQLRHLEQLPHVRPHAEQLRLPALVLGRREGTDERAEPASSRRSAGPCSR